MIIRTEIIVGNIDEVCRRISDLGLFFEDRFGKSAFGWMLENKNNSERFDLERETIIDFIEKKEIVCKYDISLQIGSGEIIHNLEVFKTSKCQNLIDTKNIINRIRSKNEDKKIEAELDTLEKSLGIYTPKGDSNLLEKINQKTIV